MEVIIVLSMAVLFRLIVWEHMETYFFMLRCRRNVKHINKIFSDIEKKIDEELRKCKS
jgi:tRNA G10  N-methylase Trm11